MALPFVEPFTGAAAVLPDPPWKQAALSATTLNRDGTGLGKASAADAGFDVIAYDDSNVYSPDQRAQVTCGGLSASLSFCGVAVRCSGTGTGFKGYEVLTDGSAAGAGHFELFKYTAGVGTALTNFAVTVANGDVIALMAVGNVLTVFKNGAVVGTFTDSTSPITTGTPGASVFNAGANGATLDNFAGDEAVAAFIAASVFPLARRLFPNRPFACANPVVESKWNDAGAGVAAGGTVYPLSLDGGVTPLGDLVRQTQRPLAAAATPAGSLVRQTSRAIAGAATPAGSIGRQTQRSLTAASTPAGALSSSHLLTKVLTGAITPAAALIRQTLRSLAGAITPSGSISRQTRKNFTGSSTPSGALVRQAQRPLSGSVASAGVLSRIAQRLLSGAVTPTGTESAIKVATRSLTGSMTPSGALVRQTFKLLTAASTPSGTLLRQLQRSLAGFISVDGWNLVLWSEDLTNPAWGKADVTVTGNAGASPDGGNNADLVTTKGLGGLPYFNQLVTMQIGQPLTRSIHAKADTSSTSVFEWLGASWQAGGVVGTNAVFDLSAGTVVGRAGFDFIDPVPGFPGWYRLQSTRFARVTNPGSAIFTDVYGTDSVANRSVLYWGAMWQRSAKATPYMMTTTAPVRRSPLVRQLQRLLAGAVTPTGAFAGSKVGLKSLTASSTPSGALTTNVRRTKTLSGGVTPTGALVRRAGRSIAGTVAPSGVLVKQTRKLLAGAAAPAGALARRTFKSFTGSTGSAGALTMVKQRLVKVLTGGVTPSGAVTHQMQRPLSGNVAPTGQVSTSLLMTIYTIGKGWISAVQFWFERDESGQQTELDADESGQQFTSGDDADGH